MFSIRCQQIVRCLFHIQNNLTSPAISPSVSQKGQPISTSRCLRDNYYESLGIPANSTQTDIKAAYYKLSMIYHPDKNQGCEDAAKKFREITQAYEVLSNYRLRRLYDKGIIHTAGSQYAQAAENIKPDAEEEEDDPQTKFYKSRFNKSKVTTSRGSAPIYDFDEWARAHYGKSFDRRKSAKERHEQKTSRDVAHTMSLQNEIAIFGVVLSFVVFYLIVYAERSYDTPKPIEKVKKD